MGHIDKYEYVSCARCDTKIRKSKILKQKGLKVCSHCWDDPKEIKPLNLKLGTPRSGYLTTTAVNSPVVFSITAAGGITPSHSYSTEVSSSNSLGITPEPSFGSCFYMQVEGSGGAVDIIANPQIVAGSTNDKLTLEGMDDTNTILLEDGTGLSLIDGQSFTLGLEDKICFRYTGSLWQETSRYKELNYT
jgi:hypothetical protein